MKGNSEVKYLLSWSGCDINTYRHEEGWVKYGVRQMALNSKAMWNLADALRYATGFTEQAHKSAINVKRNTDRKEKSRYHLCWLADSFLTKDGDTFYRYNFDRFENRVEVLGLLDLVSLP
jgi:imidazole glycerol phosphate synthase subunit HisF